MKGRRITSGADRSNNLMITKTRAIFGVAAERSDSASPSTAGWFKRQSLLIAALAVLIYHRQQRTRCC